MNLTLISGIIVGLIFTLTTIFMHKNNDLISDILHHKIDAFYSDLYMVQTDCEYTIKQLMISEKYKKIFYKNSFGILDPNIIFINEKDNFIHKRNLSCIQIKSKYEVNDMLFYMNTTAYLFAIRRVMVVRFSDNCLYRQHIFCRLMYFMSRLFKVPIIRLDDLTKKVELYYVGFSYKNNITISSGDETYNYIVNNLYYHAV